ncbi:Cell death protease [Tilletia horrida]|uniref:Pheromone-processing carboxypeptidase KEX1 n=1 Tax=Tilletia horrida TaxID=155126 RepID=A0AAN6GPI5_9BASI|nr:Cell death protease [Tilletia horrida]
MAMNMTARAGGSDDVVPAAASFWVDKIPGLPDTPPNRLAAFASSNSKTVLPPGPKLHTYAGYLPARPSNAPNYANAHLYFVLQKAQHIGSQRRLIIWFNGGPGCSSFDGLMMEVGPWRCRTDKEGQLEWATPGSAWNEYADVIYLDQPVGTGFSYTNSGGYVTSLQQAADEVVYFLRQLVKVFPEYGRGNGYAVYLAGESFAGQYIPYTAKAILDAGPTPPVDLQGAVIGNGYIDPRSQAGSELDMMVEANIWTPSSPQYTDAAHTVKRCRDALTKFPADYLPRVVPECESVLPNIIRLTTTRDAKPMCINIYDVRLSDTHPECGMNWPLTLHSVYAYLKRQDVRQALHVDDRNHPQAWTECSSRVSSALHGTKLDAQGHKEQASVMLLPGLLERGLKITMFAGDKDLICNHLGVERIGQNLVWGGQKGLNTEPLDWYVNNKYAGQWTTARNYTYVRIADASHMVGVDKPIVVHDMMLRSMGFDDGLGTAELLASAGPAARIPSVLGPKGKVGPGTSAEGGRKLVFVGAGGAAAGGGTGAPVAGDKILPMIPGVDGKTEEQVAEEANNAGSAALIFLLIAVGLGVCILLRIRRRARLDGLHAKHTANGYGDFELNDDEVDEEPRRRRRRDDAEEEGEGEEGAHELTRLVVDDGSQPPRAGEAGGASSRNYFEDGNGADPAAAAAAAQAHTGGRRTPVKVRFRDDPSEVELPSERRQAGAGGSDSGRDVDAVARRDEENIFDVGDDDDQ